LAAVALAWTWPTREAARIAVLVLLGISLLVSLICAAGGMFAPEQFRVPLLQWVLPNAAQPEAMLRAAPVLLSWIGLLWLLWRSNGLRTGSTVGLPPGAE
jgi:hypothetical protein